MKPAATEQAGAVARLASARTLDAGSTRDFAPQRAGRDGLLDTSMSALESSARNRADDPGRSINQQHQAPTE
jgi:hypothetical protein